MTGAKPRKKARRRDGQAGGPEGQAAALPEALRFDRALAASGEGFLGGGESEAPGGSSPLWSAEVGAGVVGVDEAGRGCLAGPVVAGAVWLAPAGWRALAAEPRALRVGDSKRLSPEQRSEVATELRDWAVQGRLCWAVAEGTVAEIEAENILGATRLAMGRALQAVAAAAGLTLEAGAGRRWSPRVAGSGQGVLALPTVVVGKPRPPVVAVDGLPLRPFPWQHWGVVGGDGLSWAIGAASILAKVHRDSLMVELAKTFPEYRLESNKGYGSCRFHQQALRELGPTPHHRRLFLRKLLGGG